MEMGMSEGKSEKKKKNNEKVRWGRRQGEG